MGIENLRRWHWAVLGAALGGLFGFAWMALHAPDVDASRSMRQVPFERDLLARADAEFWLVADRPGTRGLPVLRDLTVYPPDEKGRVIVTGMVLNKILPVRPDPGNLDHVLPAEAHYGKFFFPAAQPFVPHRKANTAGKTADKSPAAATTVQAYLKQLQIDHPDAAPHVTYAWWWRTPLMIGLGAGGGLVLIGGVWPTLLGLLVAAGLGKPAKEPKYDFSRFQTGPEPEKPVPPVVLGGAAGADALEEELLASLAKAEAERMEEPPARDLHAKPLEAPAAADPSREDVQYGGEFYPVAHRPAGKKD